MFHCIAFSAHQVLTSLARRLLYGKDMKHHSGFPDETRAQKHRDKYKEITAAGVPTPMKRKTWSETTVQSILTNEKYMGDAILQKTFCTDFLTKKMKKNEGELPQYHVRNSYPAIVSAEVFELVQMEIESRRQFGSRYSGRGVFASRIVCADCGGFYGIRYGTPMIHTAP